MTAALFLMTACGGSESESVKSPSAAPTADIYAQTWTKSYSETTCTDWLEVMKPAQQFAAAADILTSGRNKVDNGTGMPSDALIEEFQAATTDHCVIPSMTLTDATYAVYTGGDKFRP